MSGEWIDGAKRNVYMDFFPLKTIIFSIIQPGVHTQTPIWPSVDERKQRERSKHLGNRFFSFFY